MDQTTICTISEMVAAIDISAWITAIATFGLAILTFIYVNLTKADTLFPVRSLRHFNGYP